MSRYTDCCVCGPKKYTSAFNEFSRNSYIVTRDPQMLRVRRSVVCRIGNLCIVQNAVVWKLKDLLVSWPCRPDEGFLYTITFSSGQYHSACLKQGTTNSSLSSP